MLRKGSCLAASSRHATCGIVCFLVNDLMMSYSFQVGLQASASVSVGVKVGDEVKVQVEEAHPRDDILSLKEVPVIE